MALTGRGQRVSRLGREAPGAGTAGEPGPDAPSQRLWHWVLAVVLLGAAAAGAVFVTAGPQRPGEAAGRAGPAGAAHVRVEGAHLVDTRTGEEFVPRGVNWSSFEYACAQGWGYSALDTVPSPEPRTQQAEEIAGWGANTVRLPLNQDCWMGTREAPVSDGYHERTVEEYRQEVVGFVEELNEAGLVVVLDLHSRKRLDAPEFGNLAMPDSGSLAFWRSAAGLFAENPSVMFDAFNEPYSRYGPTHRLVFELTWPCWRDGGCAAPVEDDQTATLGRVTYRVEGMADVLAVIREAGADQPVLLSGLDYANDLGRWAEFAPDDDQLVAAFHSYDFKVCSTPACWDRVLLPLAGSVPVVTAELGAQDPLAGYVADYLAWADEHGLGALFWVWGDHPSDPMALLSRHDQPTRYGRLARSWLQSH